MKTIAKPESLILTEIMLAVFRVNGRLLEKGDQLVAPLDLTSARWQVLGPIALGGNPLTAPQIAEAMGITRQGAQKQLNKLEEEGFVEHSPNPRHLRSPLYKLSNLGSSTFAKVMALHAEWANELVSGLSPQDLKQTLKTLNAIYEQLDSPVPRKGKKS